MAGKHSTKGQAKSTAKVEGNNPVDAVSKKFKGHMVFLTISVVIAIGMTYIHIDLILHLSAAAPTVASYGQEVYDKIFRL